MSGGPGRRVRVLAIDALVRIEAGAFAQVLLPRLLRSSGLAARDRAFATDLVYDTVRRRRSLDHLLAGVSARPLGALDPPVRAGLRLGALQLLAGVPAHAAVGETVGAVAVRSPGARGFVNAVLRGLARLGPPWPWPEGDDAAAIAVRTSYPDWIVEALVREYGLVDAVATLEVGDEHPPVTLRPNPRRTTGDALAAELVAGGIHVERGRLVPEAVLVRGSGDPARLAAVAEGRATPQDQASQAVAALVDSRPGDRVLDVAAAPGGKATAMAERTGDRGLVVAADRSRARLRLVEAASRRLGLGAVAPLVADGRRLPVPAAVCPRVLLDAPCTGLGVLRRRPDARWRVRPADVGALAALQRELLEAAATAVAPGGLLVYSVCTLTAEETVGVDEWARRRLLGFEPVPPPGPPWRRRGRGALLLPSDAGTDGMFVLALRRHDDAPGPTVRGG